MGFLRDITEYEGSVDIWNPIFFGNFGVALPTDFWSVVVVGSCAMLPLILVLIRGKSGIIEAFGWGLYGFIFILYFLR